MARLRTDVYATSKEKPSASCRPAARASSMPVGLRSTSVHPVNRFSLFHVLSPWRNNTSVFTLSKDNPVHEPENSCRDDEAERMPAVAARQPEECVRREIAA